MESDHPLDSILNKYKIPIIIGFVGLVLLIGGIITSGIIPKTFTAPAGASLIKSSKSLTPASPATAGVANLMKIKVDISGAVATPGVYEMASDARIEDVIKDAGGIKSGVDEAYFSKSINLAGKLTDGMKIYIPFKSEAISVQTGSNVAGVSAENTNQLININSASASELDKLPGVGEVTSQKIIENRPYQGIEELVSKKAVSRSVYEKIKDKISTY